MNTTTKIHIFDVEHGECNIIETPTGHLIMIGVGHNDNTSWRPSAWLKQYNQTPHCIVLSNLDRDHLSDLPNFEPFIRPATIKHNSYINPDWVENKKIEESGEVHNSVQVALNWIRNVFTGEPINYNYGVEKLFFYHSPTQFQDTNNLSIITFISYAGVGVMFPGDLEVAGWREHLKNPTFVDCLRRTKIFIASHHGRESGYCAEVFNYCSPNVIIISDKSIEHDTQAHSLYQQHATGLSFGNGELRKVLTTRNDGKITIDIPMAGNYVVYIKQNY
jgi:beta-lactamase superfamily II metal-dependent hydrolase